MYSVPTLSNDVRRQELKVLVPMLRQAKPTLITKGMPFLETVIMHALPYSYTPMAALIINKQLKIEVCRAVWPCISLVKLFRGGCVGSLT